MVKIRLEFRRPNADSTRVLLARDPAPINQLFDADFVIAWFAVFNSATGKPNAQSRRFNFQTIRLPSGKRGQFFELRGGEIKGGGCCEHFDSFVILHGVKTD